MSSSGAAGVSHGSEQGSEFTSLFGCWKERPPVVPAEPGENTRKVVESASNLSEETPVEPGAERIQLQLGAPISIRRNR